MRGRLAGVVVGVAGLVAALALLVGRELGARRRSTSEARGTQPELPRDRCRTSTSWLGLPRSATTKCAGWALP